MVACGMPPIVPLDNISICNVCDLNSPKIIRKLLSIKLLCFWCYDFLWAHQDIFLALYDWKWRARFCSLTFLKFSSSMSLLKRTPVGYTLRWVYYHALSMWKRAGRCAQLKVVVGLKDKQCLKQFPQNTSKFARVENFSVLKHSSAPFIMQ